MLFSALVYTTFFLSIAPTETWLKWLLIDWCISIVQPYTLPMDWSNLMCRMIEKCTKCSTYILELWADNDFITSARAADTYVCCYLRYKGKVQKKVLLSCYVQLIRYEGLCLVTVSECFLTTWTCWKMMYKVMITCCVPLFLEQPA